MSQRQVAWAERNGGVDALIEEARVKGVHLVRLTDDQGKQLLAAGRHPFEALC